jgi:phosphohistidine phosphatase
MEIYIVRHGDAIDRNTPGITSDEMRWLTDLGREEIALAARVLARLGVRPDLVVSSPLVRARQTGEIFIEELGVERGLLMTEELAPGGSHAGLMHVLGRESGPERVVLCGHMPGVGSLASWLAWGRPELVLPFRTGEVCRVDLRGDLLVSGGGDLRWLLPPKIMQKLLDP